MAVSPSLSGPALHEWSYAGFKGGSEPGVLNITWLLRDRADAWHVLTLSQNDPAATIDDDALELIALRLLALSR